MHNLLEKLLTKRGIKNVNDLTPDEKDQFDSWQRILSEGEMSVEKIKEFCNLQIDTIKNQLKNMDNASQKNERLTVLFSVYDTLLTLINSPEAERITLEKYLNQLLK